MKNLDVNELEATMIMIRDCDKVKDQEGANDLKRLIEASLVEMIDPSYDPEIV